MFPISDKIVLGRKSLTVAVSCVPLPQPFTCGAQPLTKGEWFYPKWRWEHEVMVLRRLLWKRQGEPSSPKIKKEFLIQCRLLSRLSQQTASIWGCPCPSQSAASLDSKKAQRCMATGQLLFEGNEQLYFLLHFFTLGTSTVSSASVGRGHTWTKNFASHSAAQYILHHY